MQFNKYTLNNKKTSLFSLSFSLSADAFFLTACKEKVLISNVDVTDQVQVYSHMIDIVDVDFDPVNEKIYFTDVSGNNIYTVDPDGSNYEILLQESG